MAVVGVAGSRVAVDNGGHDFIVVEVDIELFVDAVRAVLLFGGDAVGNVVAVREPKPSDTYTSLLWESASSIYTLRGDRPSCPF